MGIEQKILKSARKIFLLYGYHGTTIYRIATNANVSKTLIHYYFRSKERLYDEINEEIAGIILNIEISDTKDINATLFIINEFRNNKAHFIHSLNKSFELDWQPKIKFFVANAFSDIHIGNLLND